MALKRSQVAKLRGLVRKVRTAPMPKNGYEYAAFAQEVMTVGVEFSACGSEILDAVEAHLRNPPPPVRRAEPPPNPGNCITSETIQACHENALDKGFWAASNNISEKLCLIHSEISETLEELRKQEPSTAAIAEELADTCIRIFDLSAYLEINLLAAIEAKMAVNRTRPKLHGKRF